MHEILFRQIIMQTKFNSLELFHEIFAGNIQWFVMNIIRLDICVSNNKCFSLQFLHISHVSQFLKIMRYLFEIPIKQTTFRCVVN